MSRFGDFVRRLCAVSLAVGPGAMPTVRYATSPLLASRTPPWRVKFPIGMIGLGFVTDRACRLDSDHPQRLLPQAGVPVVMSDALSCLRRVAASLIGMANCCIQCAGAVFVGHPQGHGCL